MKAIFVSLLCFCIAHGKLFSQTGSIHEPVRYIGGVTIDPNVHEGRLRYAIGVESRQTVRVNRIHPGLNDEHGWTYSHASNLAYWNGKFYQQYLSNPVDEHIPPGHTLLVTSEDGRNWEKPQVVFPHYSPPNGVKIPEGSTGYMMHQRMGFYISSDNRLLTLAFYGHSEDPFKEGGIGRVVREIYKDGSLGPIYFIRYSSHTDWNEANTSFPFYKTSTDKGFVKICDQLLRDKLRTLQWWDEDRGLDGFYSVQEAGSALSYYTREDGKIVALWKRSMCALSNDGGHTFSKPVKTPTLIMAGGKNWGQKTEDGKYAMVYNPIEIDEYRYPLIVITSEDGIIFDDMLLIQGEVPPRRFYGRWKDFGPCYVRGIVKGNGDPPGKDMWLTYSMNKEDIWVSRVPLPIKYAVLEDVADSFENAQANGAIENWNIYAPKWAPVDLIEENTRNKCLQFKDIDPYDYARAIRVFKENQKAEIRFKIKVKEINGEPFEVDIADRYGNRPVRISFDDLGKIYAVDGSDKRPLGLFKQNDWMEIKIKVTAKPFGSYTVWLNNDLAAKELSLAEAVKSVERISFRSGHYRNIPNRKTPNETPVPPLPGADDPVKGSIVLIDDFSAKEIY
ncbi:MAG: hypothetical protein MI975_29500 [Cytophagales bacterium]|nr:hypothetical protein [Cytophagales bacterium]